MSHGTKPGERAPGDKMGRKKAACERYRARVGKPNGKGVSGNKSGKNAKHRRPL